MKWPVAWLLAAVLMLPAWAARAQPAPDPPRQVLVLLAMPAAHFRPDAQYAAGYGDAAGRAARHRVAVSLATAHGLVLGIDWPMPAIGLHCYVMEVPAPRQPADVAALLAREPQVAWAQPTQRFAALGHADPLFDLQPAARAWRLADLHATATGAGVRVAVIDSAVQADHPDLLGQVAAAADFTGRPASGGERHGTAVAGLVAARADERIGIVGIAPGARLHALRACTEADAGEAATCHTLPLALALNAAIEQSDHVVNLSLAGPEDRLIRRLVEAALARGIDVVAAADAGQPGGGFPAAVPGVVAVADAARPGLPRGVFVAPGADVPTTVPPSRWAALTGSSYAAAQVSGLLALMRGAQVRSGGARLPAATLLAAWPDGRVDACASLARAAAACACDCGPMAPLASAAPR